MSYYSKRLHGTFNEFQNTNNDALQLANLTGLNGYHLAGRGDNDIGKFSLNGYHLAGRGDNDIGPYSLHGHHGHSHLNGKSVFSLNGDTPDSAYSLTTLIGVGAGAMVLGAAVGYFMFKKK
jgi:hypothetical protein